jgi:hypothetical protein
MLHRVISPADMSVTGCGLHIVAAAPDSQAPGSRYGGVSRNEVPSNLVAIQIFRVVGNFLYKNYLLSRSLCCIVGCSRYAQLFCYTVLWLTEGQAAQIIIVFRNISGIQCV